ncbi:NAD(P)/FAD-dependent oxidoreductase [Dactylosporangium darangshiense]|uniref:NAD(P)/FAD-dependent oxidoreductase n=1 Tax=Dactylosporangium darangshiense TaxID=579108 RepID=UPI003625FB41
MTLGSVVVVGAGLAGLSAARALRGQGFTGRLTVVGAEPHRPYDRPPLSKEFLTGTAEEPDLALERPDDDLGATWILGDPAVRLDAGRLELHSGQTLAADGFVIATGASARPFPGAVTLRSLDDARWLRHRLRTARSLLVVGAGFIGAEVASAARTLGLDVTVVEAAPAPLAGPLGAEMGAVVAGLHAAHGVRMICGVGVDRVDDGGAHLADGRVLPADVVVAGIGARPETGWLAGSDLTGLGLTDRGTASSAARTAAPECRAWSRSGTAPPGSSRASAGTCASSTGPRRASGPRSPPGPCSGWLRSRRGCRTSGPTSTGCASSSPGTPSTATR